MCPLMFISSCQVRLVLVVKRQYSSFLKEIIKPIFTSDIHFFPYEVHTGHHCVGQQNACFVFEEVDGTLQL